MLEFVSVSPYTHLQAHRRGEQKTIRSPTQLVMTLTLAISLAIKYVAMARDLDLNGAL